MSDFPSSLFHGVVRAGVYFATDGSQQWEQEWGMWRVDNRYRMRAARVIGRAGCVGWFRRKSGSETDREVSGGCAWFDGM